MRVYSIRFESEGQRQTFAFVPLAHVTKEDTSSRTLSLSPSLSHPPSLPLPSSSLSVFLVSLSSLTLSYLFLSLSTST